MRRALAALALILAPWSAQAQGEQVQLSWEGRASAAAEAVLVIRDLEGAQLLALRGPVPEGAQAMALDMPPLPRAAATMQGGLIEGARVLRQSLIRPVGERGATGPDLILRASLALGFHDLWDCAETTPVTITWGPDGGVVEHASGTWPLRPNPDPDAVPTDPDSVQMQTQGNSARIVLPGIAELDCHPALFRPLLPITAQADDSGWRVDITSDQATIDLPGLEAESLATSGLTASAGRNGVIRFAGGGMSLSLTDQRCRRAGVDMPYPITASLAQTGREAVSKGCAGSPLHLIEGASWRVTSVFGVPLASAFTAAKAVEITLQIAKGEISGRTTCNRYVGLARTDAGRLELADLGTTRLACPLQLRNLELRFLDALEVTTGFDLSRDGTLILRAGPMPVLMARRP